MVACRLDIIDRIETFPSYDFGYSSSSARSSFDPFRAMGASMSSSLPSIQKKNAKGKPKVKKSSRKVKIEAPSSAPSTASSIRLRKDPTVSGSVTLKNLPPATADTDCLRCFRKGHYAVLCRAIKCFKCHKVFAGQTEFHDVRDSSLCK
jgi:hypothetical protein